MPSQPLRPLVDRILGGTLNAWLTERRDQGLSYDAIARQLERDHGVSVTSETVRTWVLSESGPGEAA